MAEGKENSQTWKKNGNKNPHSSTPDTDTKFVLDNVRRIHEIETDPEPATMMPKDELLRWHYKLDHLSFKRLKFMAEHGVLPRQLVTCPRPMCPACQYGKQTR